MSRGTVLPTVLPLALVSGWEEKKKHTPNLSYYLLRLFIAIHSYHISLLISSVPWTLLFQSWNTTEIIKNKEDLKCAKMEMGTVANHISSKENYIQNPCAVYVKETLTFWHPESHFPCFPCQQLAWGGQKFYFSNWLIERKKKSCV